MPWLLVSILAQKEPMVRSSVTVATRYMQICYTGATGWFACEGYQRRGWCPLEGCWSGSVKGTIMLLSCTGVSQSCFQAPSQFGWCADLPEVDEKQARMLVNHVVVDTEDLETLCCQGR